MTLFFIGLACFVAIGLLLFIPCGRHIDWQKNYRQQHNIALYQRQIKTEIIQSGQKKAAFFVCKASSL